MSFVPYHDPKTAGPLANSTIQKGTREPLLDAHAVRDYIARESINLAQKTPEIMSDLIEKTQEAKATLDQVVEGMGHNLEHLRPLKKEMVEELRGLRMTTTTEVAAMLKPLEDLRKFFLGADHDKEIARLREFVDLCERLEKLKTSGFLDTVADTMLKLS